MKTTGTVNTTAAAAVMVIFVLLGTLFGTPTGQSPASTSAPASVEGNR